jgi:diguanylate cyclase (GGDEF)-like protein/PAS domain S-box-containing protein
MNQSAAANILIVDDEIQNRRLLEVLLKPEGYLTRSAANGEDALASIAESAPDLILLDVMMPGLDGYEVASLLKAQPATAHIPIIMVTAQIDSKARLNGLSAGAEEFITKPVDRAELWLRVRNLLRLKALGDFFQSQSGLLENTVKERTVELRNTEVRLYERKLAETALFAEKERLRVTLSAIGDAVMTTDVQGNITYMNPVAEEMTGWRNEEAAGLPLTKVFDIINEHTNAAAPNPVEAVLCSGLAAKLAPDTCLIHRSGAHIAIEDSAAPIRNTEGTVIGVVLVFHDVSDARKMRAQMNHQASHDALTGLINRHEFEGRVLTLLECGGMKDRQHTLLYLDLDQFKIVNDTCGHLAGDELLRQLTGLLQNPLRQNDALARLGGDEFGLLLENCPTNQAMRIAESLRQIVSDFHFVWLDKSFPLSVSIGLITFNNSGVTLSDILRMADAACYVAKDKGRNRIHVYTPEDKELAQRHGEIGWVARIQKALDEQRFVLYSQEIRPLGKNAEPGRHHELLLRMIENDEIVPPMAFIPAAERYGLMPLLDRWVIKTAFAHHASTHRPGDSIGLCAINLSGTTLCDERFPDFVREQFALHKVPPGGICFEITETAAIANLSQAVIFIQELKEIGCRFSLDDFGSGMSSFAYLKHLPVDFLKIDGGFVKEMMTDRIDHAMVESINHIGHVMGIQTIAEFVETDEILGALRTIGVDFAQGYRIEKPQPLTQIASKWLH